ncbi:MAG TPA: bifunctional phosphopantothenoylcysteine decarboxylase/phosphopantothenate--cysteine ligase CoaBC [Desulfobacterales bacterium]|nr:bifunctional phosphopantothenoylcysteine decarboxylase/phosphopantothenate--cysteine ligase CoaBC [Desulfobacterales bacterium]
MGQLAGKRIIIGVTGGIAAYKAAEWIRALRREEAEVQVVQTAAAARFITPLTLAALSGHRVYEDIFSPEEAELIPHINLARQCDLLLIAPATAQTIAKLAHGQADNLLTAIALATRAPVLICPAMNSNMYLHPATQANLESLRQYGCIIAPPVAGAMACGDEGPGRLPDWRTVREYIATALTPQDLQGIHFLITAGPTYEDIDPVRFIGNRSSGKMGYALAGAARQRGATVTLISGPSPLPDPPAITTIRVRSAREMAKFVHQEAPNAQIIIKAAAVADYSPLTTDSHKIKKGTASLELKLTANEDILKSLGESRGENTLPLLVGFAAESRDHLAHGLKKLKAKNLDLIVINDIGGSESAFANDNNQVIIINRQGKKIELPRLSKEETAHRLLDQLLPILPSP